MVSPTPEAGARLDYDVVIATRNRPDVLEITIPLLLAQTRPPAQLIVIDSSDEHAPVAAAVSKAAAGWNGPVTVEHSAPGLPLQRNRGLEHVTAPVVVFPDDDSLFFPDTAERLMDVYERDGEGAIAAVGALESMVPPSDAGLETTYQMSDSELSRRRWGGLRIWLGKNLGWFAPLKHLGRALNARRRVPDWLDDLNAVPVEYMTGFRMSFRTHAIRDPGFDDALQNYALCEDLDASFTAAEHGLIVAARDAKVYHHRFPGARADGRTMGTIEILNQLYVMLKHATPTRLGVLGAKAARRNIWLFHRFRLLRSILAARNDYGRARLDGVRHALRASRKMYRAAPDTLIECYNDALKRAAEGA